MPMCSLMREQLSTDGDASDVWSMKVDVSQSLMLGSSWSAQWRGPMTGWLALSFAKMPSMTRLAKALSAAEVEEELRISLMGVHSPAAASKATAERIVL
jgi:hypothetical protein